MEQQHIHLWVMAISMLAATLFLGIVSVNIILLQRTKSKTKVWSEPVGQRVNFVLKKPYGNTCDLQLHKLAA